MQNKLNTTMPDKPSLININIDSRALAESINKLMDTVRDWFNPNLTRRQAQADADSLLIRTNAKIEKDRLLAQRALERIRVQEIHRQENIEAIVEESKKSLPPHVSSEPVDRDWISNFFTSCQDISAQELQILWGRILANEIARPNTISRKTIAVLRELNPEQAKRFEVLCSFGWSNLSTEELVIFLIASGKQSNLLYSQSNPVSFDYRYFNKFNFSYDDFLELESLGLLHLHDAIIEITGNITLRYFSKEITLTRNLMVPAVRKIDLRVIPLTRSGSVIYKVARRVFNRDHFNDIVGGFEKSGLFDVQSKEVTLE